MSAKYLLFTIVALWLAIEKSYSQDKEIPKDLYIAATIPDSLKENANSVVRYSGTEVTVKTPGKVITRFHSIVTILNEKGDHEAIMEMRYNRKYDSYSSISMLVYNEKGDVIKKYHKGDMYDGAANDDMTLVTDERFLAVKHSIASYPVTIEQQYEEDVSSLVDLGSWHIQQNEQAVENAYYKITISNDAGFRYINKNTALKPQKSAIENFDNYLWKVSNLKAVKLEERAEKWRVLPKIEFASNHFAFYGVPGDFSSWKNFGIWIKALNADVCSLSPEREAEIRKMTDSIKTDKGKAIFLYNYLQQSMRYVSIQLGIGGLKPFPATFVDQKKYGDCKALSNYMSALLKAVKIPSYYAIINAEANQEPADISFPFDSFNHVILCVPFKGDTTWLECTSNTQPFGKLGSFTENRRALLITEDGGKLVNTPRSTMQDNQFNSEVHIALDADGGGKAHLKILSSGEYRFDYIGVSAQKTDEQKEFFIRQLNMKQPSVFEFKPSIDKNGEKEIDIDLEYDQFCDIKAGDKQFYKPRVFDLVPFTVPIEEKRKSDYYFAHPLQKACVTTIDLPQGFEVETLPVNQSLKFTYGNYEVKYVYDAAKNQVVSTAKFNLINHVIPAAKYTEMQQYLDAVAKAQNKKLVIRRKA
ncbi:MAG: Transglutaminase-like enzyme putative cysteine protease [Mucilaginibacter sp.]|nr:Transglutaminase-like enzyme putative cysteine protease [Mucilaginibacter sp.]